MMDGVPHNDDPLDVGWRDKPPTLRMFIKMVRRQALVVALCIAASFVIALIVIVYTQPLYTARVSLYLDGDGASGEPRSDMSTAIDLDTNVELIRSDDTVASVIRDLDLISMPEFASNPGSLNAMLGSLRATLGLAPDLPEAIDPLPAAIIKVRSNLQVARNGNTRVIDLRYTSTSPARAAQIANAFVQAHLGSIFGT